MNYLLLSFIVVISFTDISLEKELSQLKETKRLHICFGSRKLFNAQHHLKENNYKSHLEWLEDGHPPFAPGCFHSQIL
jgi:hypothetical protein